MHCKLGLKTNSVLHVRISGRMAAASPLNPLANNANLPDTHPAKVLKASHGQTLMVKKLSENAVLPKRGSERAAGYDLARCRLGGVGRWLGVACWALLSCCGWHAPWPARVCRADTRQGIYEHMMHCR